jgi:hypothetical protein
LWNQLNKEFDMPSRKLFVALAKVIQESIGSVEQREALARAIIPALMQSNPRFDSERFMAAVVRE